MGQSSSQNLQQSRMQVPKINELQFWRQVNDIRYGEIKVYKLNDGHAVAVKDHILQDEEQWLRFKQSAEMNMTSRDKNLFLIQMIDLQHVTEKELCTQMTQAHSVYEYFDEYLERVITEQSATKQHFEEIEIAAMIHCTLMALQKLTKQQKSHGDIRPLTISVTSFPKKSPHRQNEPLPVYKLTDIQELTDMNAFRRCVAKQHAQYNLSPEQLTFLKQRVLRPTYDLDKSDVFSIGLTALQMATLNSIYDIYDNSNYLITTDKLDGYIREMKTLYSEQLCSIVCQLLQLAPENRPNSYQANDLLIGFRYQLEDYFRQSTIKEHLPNYSIEFRQTNKLPNRVEEHQIAQSKLVDTSDVYEQMEILEQRAKVALQRSQDAQVRYQRTPGKRIKSTQWEPTNSYQIYNNLTPITQKELQLQLSEYKQEIQSNKQSTYSYNNNAPQYLKKEVNSFHNHQDQEEYEYNQQEIDEKPNQSVLEQIELANSNQKVHSQRPINNNTASFSHQQLFESINTEQAKPYNQTYNNYQQYSQQSIKQYEQQQQSYQQQPRQSQLMRDQQIQKQLTGQYEIKQPISNDNYYNQQSQIPRSPEPQNIYPTMEYQHQTMNEYQQQRFNHQITESFDSQQSSHSKQQVQVVQEQQSATRQQRPNIQRQLTGSIVETRKSIKQ
ncbi:unnamed protein product (macronuclear) [Paramecium tetraurelia]|uniref:non-specific serine/threonine protein kinase n=1 Tax=Paramecium tetraurelia TaxID=5888 RepID=A0E938_PARTE|nr:uncharacterized protein GSPATT00024536001 [Paramecium tetraurelia]CAK91805.1 unnamed protein product [Paramecium tetraurelia]|eukprot:XP_001459202.1 hypothetical protein (macronuclear) [Paramecium tetraurelia strain d4-2]